MLGFSLDPEQGQPVVLHPVHSVHYMNCSLSMYRSNQGARTVQLYHSSFDHSHLSAHAGAFSNSSDALTSAASVLQLLAAQEETRKAVEELEVQRVLQQVRLLCGMFSYFSAY